MLDAATKNSKVESTRAAVERPCTNSQWNRRISSAVGRNAVDHGTAIEKIDRYEMVNLMGNDMLQTLPEADWLITNRGR